MRKTLIIVSVLVLVAALAALSCGGTDGEPDGSAAGSAPRAYPRFDGASAYALVERQVAFGPRVPGSPGHRAMAEWVETYFGERADTLIVQRFTHVTVEGDTLPLVNFLARFRPEAKPSLLR